MRNFDVEFVLGQQHYQNGGKKEDLKSRVARAGWAAEKYQHDKKVNKRDLN